MDENLLYIFSVLVLFDQDREVEREVAVTVSDPYHESPLLDVRLESFDTTPIIAIPFHHMLNLPPRSPRRSPRQLRR